MCTEVLIKGHLVTNLGEMADLLGGLEAVPFDDVGHLAQMRERLPDGEVRETCLCPVDIEAIAARLGGTIDRSDPFWWEIVPAEGGGA